MKPGPLLTPLIFAAVAAMLLTGCLFKSAPVPVRHFVLAPVSTNREPANSNESLSIGIGSVKMPSYLLKRSVAVRNGANEIVYLEDALWGERLDQCFQRTLAANLSQFLSTDNVYTPEWGRNHVAMRVFINVQQFEVDAEGHGTLVAQWRITAPESATPLKSGTTHLDRAGPSPRGNPGVIPATLSELTAEFSKELAQSIRETKGNP